MLITEAVLERLIDGKPTTTAQLADLSPKLSNVMSRLRQAGHQIDALRVKGGAVYTYRGWRKPQPVK